MTGCRTTVLTRDEIARNMDALIAVAADIPGEYWSAEHFLAELPRKFELSFARWHDGDLIGYAIVSQKPAGPHLHHFMVRRDHRNNGIGSDMLRRLLERCPGLTLKTNRPDALRFYERHGFTATGEENGYTVMGRVRPPAPSGQTAPDRG